MSQPQNTDASQNNLTRIQDPPQDASQNQLIINITHEVATNTMPQKYNYRQMDNTIQALYFYECDQNSTICDVIAMYLMGQKILYTEAKTYCEQHLNYLMLPAIFITAACSILSLTLKDYYYGPIIVSSLNGVNAFLLAVINYMKLDSKSEAHRTAAYKFDVLQSNLVFNSGKLLFMKDKNEKLREIIEETEKGVQEIKQTNQFILPEYIRFTYPKLYSINVFAEVKKINNKEILIVNSIKDIYNDIQDLKAKLSPFTLEDETKLAEKEEIYRRKVENFIRLKDEYLKIDDEFEKEMKVARQKQQRGCTCCSWLKS
jgi:hypothetical protein